jgi:hypothetical protein
MSQIQASPLSNPPSVTEAHSAQDREAQLIVSGALKMPEEELDWNQFFLIPAGSVPREASLEAAIFSQGDW